MLQTFADQAVIAIENVRLFDEVQAQDARSYGGTDQQTGSANMLKVIAARRPICGPVLKTHCRKRL